MSPRIAVVGSVNMDLVVRAPRFPDPGETLLGGVFAAYPGGKGANQAVAAARLGAAVEMVALVGDPWGAELVRVLRENGVGTAGVEVRPDVASGVGLITVTPTGENAIVVASGANARLGRAEVLRHRAAVEAADVVVLQLETTPEALAAAVEIARGAGTAVVLNAAPAGPVPAEVMAAVDVLVVNRVEAQMLAGDGAALSPEALLARLLALGAREAVLTLGAKGALHADASGVRRQPAFPVTAVDTTACGDAFTGAWAVARAEGRGAEEALRFACAAGAIAATRAGAIPSLPSRAEVVNR